MSVEQAMHNTYPDTYCGGWKLFHTIFKSTCIEFCVQQYNPSILNEDFC